MNGRWLGTSWCLWAWIQVLMMFRVEWTLFILGSHCLQFAMLVFFTSNLQVLGPMLGEARKMLKWLWCCCTGMPSISAQDYFLPHKFLTKPCSWLHVKQDLSGHLFASQNYQNWLWLAILKDSNNSQALKDTPGPQTSLTEFCIWKTEFEIFRSAQKCSITGWFLKFSKIQHCYKAYRSSALFP